MTQQLLTLYSIHTSKRARIRSDRYFLISVLGNTGEGRFRVGVRAGAGNSELLR